MIKHLAGFKKKYPDDVSYVRFNKVFKEFNGSTWMKIFFHSVVNGKYWDRQIETLLDCNEEDKYSKLGVLREPRFKKRHGYEFLLEYPELEGYNQWFQTGDPTTFTWTEIPVPGYQPIHISWSGHYWGGLSRVLPDNDYTFIRGSQVNFTWWYYSIGQTSKPWGSGDLAGPYNPGKGFLYVNLWVKQDVYSDDFSVFKKGKMSFLMKRQKILIGILNWILFQ